MGFAAACQVQPPTVHPSATPIQATATSPPSSTPPATATASATPTATRTLRPSNTPLPPVSFESEAAESSYQVPLTIQQLNPFEATAHFELDRPEVGWVLYQPEGHGDERWWASPLDREIVGHVVPLVGLTPGATYRVQVGLGDDLSSLRIPSYFGTSWGPITFTAPQLGDPALRFGVIGDSGFGDDATKELVQLMQSYDLDFTLHTGDVVYNVHEQSDAPEAYAVKFYTIFEPLLTDSQVFPVLGNHEYDRFARYEGRPYFTHAFPTLTDPSVPEGALGSWYAFERSGVQFLMLDTQAFFGMGGREEQTAWLAERLADPSYRFSIPVFHIPPYTSGGHRNDGKVVQSDWNPLFVEAGVPVAFSGHSHNYERIERDGMTFIVSGGGSPVLYHETGLVEGSQDFHRRMHFVLAEVLEDRINLTTIDRDGSELDRTTIPLS